MEFLETLPLGEPTVVDTGDLTIRQFRRKMPTGPYKTKVVNGKLTITRYSIMSDAEYINAAITAIKSDHRQLEPHLKGNQLVHKAARACGVRVFFNPRTAYIVSIKHPPARDVAQRDVVTATDPQWETERNVVLDMVKGQRVNWVIEIHRTQVSMENLERALRGYKPNNEYEITKDRYWFYVKRVR